MAKYTTELRTLIKNGFDIGLNDYPIFDEDYRPILNKKIVDHYYFSEIGFETAAMFKHYLNATMREIMPVYNKMYLSDNLITDPLRDFDETTEETRNKTGAVTVEASAEDSSSSSGTTGTQPAAPQQQEAHRKLRRLEQSRFHHRRHSARQPQRHRRTQGGFHAWLRLHGHIRR